MFYLDFKDLIKVCMLIVAVIVAPIVIFAFLYLSVVYIINSTKMLLSKQIEYTDIGIVKEKEFKVEEVCDSDGSMHKANRYYVTVSCEKRTKRFNNYSFYNSVEVGDEVKVYFIEYWYKEELYRIDFHYDENLAGWFFD